MYSIIKLAMTLFLSIMKEIIFQEQIVLAYLPQIYRKTMQNSPEDWHAPQTRNIARRNSFIVSATQIREQDYDLQLHRNNFVPEEDVEEIKPFFFIDRLKSINAEIEQSLSKISKMWEDFSD